MTVPFFQLNYDSEEREAVMAALDSEWISMGPRCELLEQRFAAIHGTGHGVALSSCTAALHLALHALGIGPGDEVIIPSLTFVATANSVLMNQATPVFADIKSVETDWTIDPEDVAQRITPRTKCIIAMHYGGHGADMPSLKDLADAHGLSLVEDACHAPMGKLGNRMLGTFGDLACYSFYANKNISAAEGGMVITDDASIANRVRSLRSHGMTTSAYDRIQGEGFYEVREFGYNYRMDDIRASLALVQLEKLPADIQRRAKVVKRYRSNLQSVSGITLPFQDYIGRPVHHVFGILTNHPDRHVLRSTLRKRGISTSMHYPPVHKFACYNQHTASLPKTEEVGCREISLPVFPGMRMEQVDYVCNCLKDSLKVSHDHA